MSAKLKEKRQASHEGWNMTRRERVAYYTGDTGRLFCMSLFNTFVSLFLIFKGVSLTRFAIVMLIVKIIDACDDVVFGFLVDRFNPTKWSITKRLAGKGKYLPWYRVTFFLYPVITILFFLMPSSFSETGKIIWFVVFYLLYDLTCTLNDVPMNSMVMTLTDNVEERNAILKTKGVIAIVAVIVISTIWQYLISEHVGMSISSVCVVSAVIFLISMFPLATKVQEHNCELKNVEEAKEDEKYTFREMLACIKTNKYIMIFFLAIILSGVLATGTALNTFISFYCYGDSMVLSIGLLVAFIPGVILSMYADKIAKKWGRRNALIYISIFQAVGGVIIWLMGYSHVALVVSISMIIALPNTVRSILITFVAPDTIEYTRYKTGQDCSGIFFALNNFVNKIVSNVASSLGMFILGLAGWISVEATDFADLAAQGIEQPQSAIDALWACNTIIPAIGCALMAVILLFYTLRDKDAELMSKCNSGHITREECEAQLSRKY